MQVRDVMEILEEMKVGIFATVDSKGNPHARPIHILSANDEGVFFMTGSETHFYQQLLDNERVALTAMSEEEYLIQVIRIEGLARPAGQELLDKVFADNPYIQHIYQEEESQKGMQIFQLYEGNGFYHSLTQSHKYVFPIGKGGATSMRTI